MGTRISPGFTIIEVMLFLAVTGLMIAGIMSSATSSLNAQRYRDGVESIKNSISSEYAKVYSLTNARDIGDPCAAVVTSRTWGTSECFYVGRLIEISESGTRLTVHPVIAEEVPADGDHFTERFVFMRDDTSELVESRELDWGLAAVQPGTIDSPAHVAILILRSPLDGSVVTYNLLPSSETALPSGNLGIRLRNTDTRTEGVHFCIADLNGSLEPGTRQAILISKSATSAADVESRMGDGNVMSGNPTC